MSILFKQPSESKVLEIEFSGQLATDDSLSAITSVTEATGGLTIASTSINGTKVQGTFSGGTDGTTYTIEAIVTTTGGETLEVDVYLLVTDSPSGLPTTYLSLKVAIADFLAWGRNTEGTGTDWSDDEEARLDDCLNSGYQQFLYPPILPNEKTAHRWTFLRPTTSFDTVASTHLYDMPSGFGAPIGDLLYDEDEDEDRVIRQVSPGYIDRQRAIDDAEGRPYYFALRPKSVAGTSLQTTECMLYPTPDAAYGIVYHYDARAGKLSGSNLYPLGARDHGETLLQSCRDIAAQRYKDGLGTEEKQREHDLFMQRLQAAVEYDRRNAPAFLGYNNDGNRTIVTRHGTEFSVSLSHNLGGG